MSWNPWHDHGQMAPWITSGWSKYKDTTDGTVYWQHYKRKTIEYERPDGYVTEDEEISHDSDDDGSRLQPRRIIRETQRNNPTIPLLQIQHIQPTGYRNC
mmetsp:Transcript_49211/g.78597  ORF Transcript_49211/g.78597 Transcript_49211/m.78597 type:complete len:100 (+) Transcript_49211:3-302(+)